MSWGERSCQRFGTCKVECTIKTCNVDCYAYLSNGNKPNSKHFQSAVAPVKLFPKKKKFR
jgi:hypothetical protein